MKKLLVVLLALILCVTTLASCDFLKNFADIRNGETGEEDKKPVFNVDAAADYVYNLYKNKNTTASDFEVTAKVNILGAVHTVEWSVDTDKVTIDVKDENTFIVNVDEESPEELAYVLTATIKGGDKTATKSFNLTVPKYVLTPFEEYIDKTEGDVVVKGIVVAINSKAAGNTRNHLFLEDLNGKGGYYSYQMDADPVADLGIKVGMIVEVSGPVSPYSGMQEIKGGSARIVDPTIHEVKTFDITNAFANGESLKNYVGLLVTVKGVEITGQELGGTSEYLKFKLNGKEAYVRTYVTDFPTTLKADDKATIDAAHAEHFGWTANATGVLVLYSNNPYLIPVGVDCFEYLELIVKSDEEKIADVLGEIKLGTSFTGDAVVDLPAAVYPEVTLTWESNSEYVVVADGKLTITVPNEAVEAILTLTAKCGEKTETKTFTLKLSKTAESVKDIIDLGASMGHNQYTTEKHLVAGIISEVYNTQYGNMKIVDEFGNVLTIYGTYSADGSTRYDAMENAPVAGDYVVILGIVGQYNGTPQIKNGWVMSITKPTSVKDAIDTGASMEHDTYTPDKVIVTGVITEVYNTKYGNMKITDENGNILTIYGTYSSTGTTRYDAMSVQPVAGDTVTIYGILGQYSGTPQIKNGWIVARTAGSDTPECTEHVDADGDKKCDKCGADMPNDDPTEVPATLAEQIAAAQKLANGAYLPYETTMTGTVVGTIQESSRTPGSWRLNLTDGTNTVTLYYVPVTGTPVEGCTITVTGKLTAYNGSAQFDETATAKVEGETPDTPECTEHVDADGDKKCDKCGADVPAVQPPVTPDPTPDTELSVKEAIDFALTQEHNVFTEGKYYVTGVITEVYNTQYGNMRITDENGNILTLYGTFSADGSIKYANMEVKPVAGDTITIYGIVGQYNGTPQVKNGWITAHTPAAPSEDGLKLDLWKSDDSLFVVDGLNIKYNGAGNTYACVGSNVADLAAGNNTFTVTITNNGAADTRVRFDLQGSVQVGNHKVCNVTAVGGDVWTDAEWGGSAVTVPAGQSVTLVITYDENTERGTVVDLIIFVDGARGDANTYSADITLSGMAFSKVEPEAPECKEHVDADGDEKCDVCGADVPKAEEPKDPAADSTLTIEEVIALGASKEHNTYTEGKYYVTGVITEVYNTQYGNMKITDEAGNILTIYGTYSADGSTRYDAMEVKPVAGDTVTIYGIVGQYNGTPQIKNGWIVNHTAATPDTPDTPDELTSEVFNITATGGTLAEDGSQISWEANSFNIVSYKNESTSAIRNTDSDHFRCYAKTKFTLVGKTEAPIVKVVFTVTESKYASVLVENATAAGYTATADGLVVTIVVNATSLEFVNGAQVRIKTIEVIYTDNGGTEEPPVVEPPVTGDPAADSTLTVEEVIALGASKEHNTYTEGKYYVTGVITEVYNTTYGNMKITDDKGNILTIYGTYSADGSARYDAMEVKPVAGDTVTIYGIVGQYNGTPQIKNGWVVKHTVAETPETPDTPDTPETPDTPVVGDTKTYVFAEYEAGEQYAANEVHKLDDMVTVTTNDAHFTKQIRLYQQAANSYGPARNGTAIFETAAAIKSLSINAGEKAVPIEVYGSTNGTDWVLITTITATKTYTDYEITLGSTEYTYIKLAAVAGQARVASVTFGF